MKRVLLLLALLLVALSAQAQVTLMTAPRIQFLDTSGNPLASGHAHTYVSGTTTNQATYTDSTGGTANANPVVFDSGGFAGIWLTDGLAYTIAVHNSSDVLQWSVDGVISGDLETALVVGTTAVTFTSTPTFDSSTASYFSITLTGNVTSSTISNASDGRIIYFNICQDATGGRTFTWPASVLNAPTIGSGVSVCTSVSYIYDGTNWRELAPSSRGSAVFDTATTGILNNIRVVDGIKFAATGAGILAASDDLPAGGGMVFIPAGTYAVSSAIAVTGNNVFLVGAGREATILSLANSSDAHVITFTNTTGGGVFNLEIDGNRANQTSQVHCIRGEGTTRLLLSGLYLNECEHYGIGLEAGTIRDTVVSSLDIENVGADGIDVKNVNDDNSGNRIDGVVVRSHGLNAALGAQAGFDLRGPWVVNNVEVLGFGTAQGLIGIRLREGEALSANGIGARYSSVSNFYIEPSTAAGTFGIVLDDIRTSVSNGTVNGAETCYRIDQQQNQLANVIAESCTDIGFHFRASTSQPTDGDRATVVDATARNSTDEGFRVGADNVKLIGIISDSNDDGIVIDGTADGTTIVGGQLVNNTTADFTNSGTNTVVLATQGSGQNFMQLAAVINDSGADSDSRIEGDTDANLIYVDAGNDRVGIGDSTPTFKLDVAGTFRATGASQVDGNFTIASGTAIAGHLSSTASLDFDFSGAGITEHDLTITVTGAAVADPCVVGLPTALQVTGLMFTCFVSATNTVTVRGMDVTSANPNPAAATVRVDTWQH